MSKGKGYRALLEELLHSHRRLVLIVGGVAFAVGFIGGSAFMLQGLGA